MVDGFLYPYDWDKSVHTGCPSAPFERSALLLIDRPLSCETYIVFQNSRFSDDKSSSLKYLPKTCWIFLTMKFITR